MSGKGLSGHQSARMLKDEWLTPLHIVRSLGDFDLDPCAPAEPPWPTARSHISLPEDGLSLEWRGRVWLNPPYGTETGKWLQKLANHGDGIALIFARTETRMFFEQVWDRAHALFFFKGRITFHHVDGSQGASNGGAPSVLVAYGQKNENAIRGCGLDGFFVSLGDPMLR